jgi:hypothetical protein
MCEAQKNKCAGLAQDTNLVAKIGKGPKKNLLNQFNTNIIEKNSIEFNENELQILRDKVQELVKKNLILETENTNLKTELEEIQNLYSKLKKGKNLHDFQIRPLII